MQRFEWEKAFLFNTCVMLTAGLMFPEVAPRMVWWFGMVYAFVLYAIIMSNPQI